jgi:hypothetical protein
MLDKSQLTRDIILKNLSIGVCKVYFRKVTNGRYRSLYCSLNPNLLKSTSRKYLEQIFSPMIPDVDLLPVYDIIDKSWKSFRISTVLYFYTTEELKESQTELLRIKELRQ